MEQVLILLLPVALAVAFTVIRYRGQENTVASFFVANRDVSTPIVALSIASSWVWTVAMFVVPQKVYELGVIATVALVFVNALSIVLLGVLVPRVRAFSKNKQLTLPQFTEERDGKRTGAVFTIGVLGVQVYSVITHLLAAALLLKFMTGTVDTRVLVVLLAGGFVIVAGLRGLQSSIVTDVVKYSAIFAVVILAILATNKAGGVSALAEGATGLRAPGTGFFDAKTIWTFVIPVSIALLSAVAMDDQLYQRGFAARSHPKRAYFLAALLFLVIPLGLSLLGFLAANKSLGITVAKEDLQIVNLLTLQRLLPEIPLYVVGAAIMTALIGSGGSALHAAGNVGAKNVVMVLWPGLGDSRLVLASRITMLVTLAIGTLTALSGVGIFELWIGWGMFRAVLFIPLIALIFSSREALPSVFWWIIIGLPVTLVSFVLFRLSGEPTGIASGQAILVAWAMTFTMWVLHLIRSKGHKPKTV